MLFSINFYRRWSKHTRPFHYDDVVAMNKVDFIINKIWNKGSYDAKW